MQEKNIVKLLKTFSNTLNVGSQYRAANLVNQLSKHQFTQDQMNHVTNYMMQINLATNILKQINAQNIHRIDNKIDAKNEQLEQQNKEEKQNKNEEQQNDSKNNVNDKNIIYAASGDDSESSKNNQDKGNNNQNKESAAAQNKKFAGDIALALMLAALEHITTAKDEEIEAQASQLQKETGQNFKTCVVEVMNKQALAAAMSKVVNVLEVIRMSEGNMQNIVLAGLAIGFAALPAQLESNPAFQNKAQEICIKRFVKENNLQDVQDIGMLSDSTKSFEVRQKIINTLFDKEGKLSDSKTNELSALIKQHSQIDQDAVKFWKNLQNSDIGAGVLNNLLSMSNLSQSVNPLSVMANWATIGKAVHHASRNNILKPFSKDDGQEMNKNMEQLKAEVSDVLYHPEMRQLIEKLEAEVSDVLKNPETLQERVTQLVENVAQENNQITKVSDGKAEVFEEMKEDNEVERNWLFSEDDMLRLEESIKKNQSAAEKMKSSHKVHFDPMSVKPEDVQNLDRIKFDILESYRLADHDAHKGRLMEIFRGGDNKSALQYMSEQDAVYLQNKGINVKNIHNMSNEEAGVVLNTLSERAKEMEAFMPKMLQVYDERLKQAGGLKEAKEQSVKAFIEQLTRSLIVKGAQEADRSNVLQNINIDKNISDGKGR